VPQNLGALAGYMPSLVALTAAAAHDGDAAETVRAM
jgi:hypothetical protein